MIKIDLNLGGIIAGAVWLCIVLSDMYSNPDQYKSRRAQRAPFAAAGGGAFVGSVLWRFVFKKDEYM